MTTRSGHTVDASWSMVRLSDGSRVGIGLDVTERKRDELEMRTARAAAETANRARATEERAEQADQIAGVLVDVVREPGDQQRLEHRGLV